MSTDQVLDMQAIETLRSLSPDDGGEFVRELIAIYLQDTPQRLAEIDQALIKNDAVTLVRAAHSIKGSSGNFGANRLAQLAAEIEHQGKAGNLAALVAPSALLKADYALVAQALEKISQGN